MRRTGPLLALGALLGAVGALAIAWMLGAFDRETAAPPPDVVAVTLDAGAPVAALEARAATLQAASEAVGSGQLDVLLEQDPLELSLPEVEQGGVTLTDVEVRRTGADASAEATVDPAQLAAFAPGDVDLAYDEEASADANGAIVLSGSASALGIDLPVTVSVGVQDGRVVAVPEGLPIGETVLFEDPRIVVTGLTAEPQADGLLRVRAEAQVVG